RLSSLLPPSPPPLPSPPPCSPPFLPFFLYSSAAHRDLPSFPTRRSSDLQRASGRRPTLPRCGVVSLELQIDIRVIRGAERDNTRSEEHTSELQSLTNLVCRLLLEKKKNLLLRCIAISQKHR